MTFLSRTVITLKSLKGSIPGMDRVSYSVIQITPANVKLRTFQRYAKFPHLSSPQS